MRYYEIKVEGRIRDVKIDRAEAEKVAQTIAEDEWVDVEVNPVER